MRLELQDKVRSRCLCQLSHPGPVLFKYLLLCSTHRGVSRSGGCGCLETFDRRMPTRAPYLSDQVR